MLNPKMHIRQIAQHLELGNIRSQEGNLCVTWNMNKEKALLDSLEAV